MAERPIHKVEVAGDTTGLKEFANGAEAGVIIPQGTTAQRPATPVEGTIRYNNQDDALEFYIGSSWIQISEGGIESLVGNAAADGTTKGVASFTATEFTASSGNISLGTVPATKLGGTTSEFNGALSDGSFATLAGAETIENKTIDSGNQTLMTINLSDVLGGSLVFSGTTAEFNSALSDGSFSTLQGVESFTSKTIDLSTNTISGTTAEFNAALSDNDFATLAGNETLANKTLSSATLANQMNADSQAIINLNLKGYFEQKQALSVDGSGNVNIDLSAGNTGELLLTSNVTGWVFTNVPNSGLSTFTLEITQDSTTPYTVATTVSVNGAGLTPKTAGGSGYSMTATVDAIDLVTFIFIDAGAPYINALQDFS